MESYPVLFPIKRDDFVGMTPSVFTIAPRFWSHVTKSDGCWEWSGSSCPDGYGRFAFAVKPFSSGRRRRSYIRSSRLAWMLTYGEIPGRLLALHHCDNPACVRPDHLFLGDEKDNFEDALAKGRRTRVIPGATKLTEVQVREVKSRIVAGEKVRKIADSLGVHYNTIWDIANGRKWAHV